MTVTAEEAEDAVKIILEYIENGGLDLVWIGLLLGSCLVPFRICV